MTALSAQRRRSAVMMADMAGYSRLISEDVEGTVVHLKSCRRIFSDQISLHRGRVINAPGDSILAEFSSADDALHGALAIQSDVAQFNAPVPGEQRMYFRIGISFGEVIADEDAIYGDEVNIAARLETIADPGGICITSITYSNIQEKTRAQFDYMGSQFLKNIPRPIPVYRVVLGGTRQGVKARGSTMTHLDKPSIAVLPFSNFSEGAEQEYFADGITEDIITELSRFKSLFVIARNSTFVYKGRSVTVQQVARDLGVQYVLEGSVRKAGTRVRITAQLVDAEDGRHLWADRYDREFDDVFQVQDEIVRTIVANLPRRMEAANLERIKRTPTENMVAYDLLLRAKNHHHRRTAEDNAQALEALDRAIELDPELAQAYAWKACVLGQAMVRGYRPRSMELLDQGLELARKSLQIDPDDSESHRLLAEILIFRRRYEEAFAHQEQAYALNPNDPRIVALRGQLLTWMGRAEEGVSWIELARRLDPYPPDLRADSLGLAQFASRRYAEAIQAYKLIGKPEAAHHANLAACHAMLDLSGETEAHRQETLRLEPKFSIDSYMLWLPYQHAKDREHHRSALGKAGFS